MKQVIEIRLLLQRPLSHSSKEKHTYKCIKSLMMRYSLLIWCTIIKGVKKTWKMFVPFTLREIPQSVSHLLVLNVST